MGDRESAETLVKTVLGGAGSGDALSASMSSTREDIRALKSIILNGGAKEYDLRFYTPVNDYGLVITYYMDEQRFYVAADKDETYAKFNYSVLNQ